jgi:flagellar biosynthetic protein FliO
MKYLATLLVVIPYTIYAQTQDTLNTVAQMPDINYSPGLASIIFKLVVSLAVIVGLIYLTVFLLKKLNNKGLPGNDSMIKIISRSYLTPKQSLYIVKLGESYSVLGVGESSVSHIKDLSADEVDVIRADDSKPRGFQNVLKSVLGK